MPITRSRSLILATLLLGGCGGDQASGVSSLGTTSVVNVPSPSPSPTPTATPTPSPTPTPTPTPTPGPTTTSLSGVLSEGDSISFFWGGNHTGIYAATHPTVTFYGKAISGSTLNDKANGNGLLQRQSSDLALNPKVLTVLIGANDVGSVGFDWSGYPTPQAYLDALFAYLAPFKAKGIKIAVGTVLPQCVSGNTTTGNDQRINSYRVPINEGIRAAVGTKIDAVIDYAADPVMGPDSAACDVSLYNSGLHPTDGAVGGVGGQGKLELIYATVVDRLLQQ